MLRPVPMPRSEEPWATAETRTMSPRRSHGLRSHRQPGQPARRRQRAPHDDGVVGIGAPATSYGLFRVHAARCERAYHLSFESAEKRERWEVYSGAVQIRMPKLRKPAVVVTDGLSDSVECRRRSG